MDSPLFECPVCHQSFDLSNRLARRLLVCEHLVCSSCLTQILSYKDRSPRCPLNCSELPKKDLNGFPVCLIVRQLLEERPKQEMCLKHNKKIQFICINDKEKLCEECLESHSEDSHRFRQLDKIIKNANESRQNIKQLVKDMAIFHKDIERVIDERCQKYIKDLNHRFNEFRSLVNKKEQELIAEANSYFKSQKKQINDLLGENSELLKDLTKKELKLANILIHEDLLSDFKVFDKIQRQIDEWKLKIDSMGIRKKLWDKLEQGSKTFYDSFVSAENQFLYQIRSIGLESSDYLLQNIFMNLNNQIISNDPSNGINDLKIKSFLNINFDNDCLKITTLNKQKEGIIIMDKVNKVNEVVLILDKALPKEDITLLSHIWKRFTTITTVYFKFHSETVSNALSDVLSKGLETCSSISVDISKYNANKYPEVLLLIKNILSKARNLDSLVLNANGANFPVDTLKNIFKSGFFGAQKLKSFNLDFEKTNITDEDVENFFVEMPSLELFTVDLSETKITDKTLEICGKNTLSRTDKLKEMRLFFNTLPITDYGVDFIFKHFKNLTNFELFLENTRITDKAIELLSKRMSSKFKDLIEFRLSLWRTNVFDNFFSQLFGPMPKLQEFLIGLSNTHITDKTINYLVQNTLISIEKPLVYLDLILNETDCTDKSISGMLKRLNHVEELHLSLNCEGITDISLAPFIREKIPTMKILKQLELNVSDNSVSQQIKDEIKTLEDRINGQ